jgi:hypothetical protein
MSVKFDRCTGVRPANLSASALVAGQVRTSGVRSCVRSRRKMAADTSLSAGLFESANGSVAAAPVPHVGTRTGPADVRVRGHAPRLSFE